MSPFFAIASKVCHLQYQGWCLRVQYLPELYFLTPEYLCFILQHAVFYSEIFIFCKECQALPCSGVMGLLKPQCHGVLHALERCGESKAEA